MKFIFSVIFYFLMVSNVNSQLNHNIHYMEWVFGYHDSPELNLGWNIIDFNDGSVQINSYHPSNKDYRLGRSGSGICDSTGRIELISNICDIRDENLIVLPESDVLTDNEVIQETWCDQALGYPIAHASRFYPREYGYDLLYLDTHEDFLENNTIRQISSKTLFRLKVTQLAMDEYNLDRDTLLKGIFHNGRLRTTWHKNNKDIWVILNPLQTDTLQSYLLEGDSLVLKHTSVLGPKLTDAEAGFFSSIAFSAKNDLMSMVSPIGIMLYQFNDETGAFSNYRNFEIPFFGRSGVCFSPSDRFLYAGNADNIYQVDLESDFYNPIIHDYGSFFNTEYGWPIGVGNMVTGPDCRIYISAGTTTNFMHVIHNPEGEGEAVNLQANIPIPNAFDFDFPSIPNLFPHCNSTIEFDIRTSVLNSIDDNLPIVVFPNPTSDFVTISLSAEEKGVLFVYDMQGRLMLREKNDKLAEKYVVKVSEWPRGMYFLRYQSERGIYSGKLVVDGWE